MKKRIVIIVFTAIIAYPGIFRGSQMRNPIASFFNVVINPHLSAISKLSKKKLLSSRHFVMQASTIFLSNE